MNIIKYNPDQVPAASGMVNYGNICYYNSLIQALRSVPTFASSDADYSREALLRYLQNSRDRARLAYGQQQEDASEGYNFIMEMMPRSIQSLFEIRHRSVIQCTCGHKFASEAVINNCIIVSTQQEFDNICRETTALSDYICDNCKCKGTSTRLTMLTMVGEVIVIIMRKYNKFLLNYPEHLKIGDYEYSLIAQIDHYGTMGGGHYTATAKRNNGDIAWFLLNDSQVSQISWTPTETAYVLFYHYR